MTAEQALTILDTLEAAGLRASLDGGWGVDALIGHQTRDHLDLDLVVDLSDVDAIKTAVFSLGFSLVEDHLPVRFVMRDESDIQLDFHTVTYDAEGGGVQQLPDGDSFRYPPEGFTEGRIANQSVACISAEVQLLCHLGYEPTAKDASDVLLLCRKFSLTVPPVYRRFKQ